ncbi:MAG: CDP-glycerol glycerophosphotransferase family protein [Lachnospiraceae bacterium]|nr:CDP-glycerol glycerophosphotransferase family protein [Lachnospiraceae bacterium]
MSIRNDMKKMAPEGAVQKYRTLREDVIEKEFKFFSLFPVEKDKVVFCNVWGYGDNPKWIAESYVRQLRRTTSLSKSAIAEKVIFITSKPPLKEEINEDAECITFLKTNTKSAIYALATAGIWVDCNRKENYIQKRKNQIYIQTWHGGLPLKRLELDCREYLPQEYIKNALRDTGMTDIYISNSEYCNELYRRAFGFKKRIFCFGSARMDPLIRPVRFSAGAMREKLLSRLPESVFRRLLNEAYIKAFKMKEQAKQGEEQEQKDHLRINIALYAPTYRDSVSEVQERANELGGSIINALENRFGGKFVVVTRFHPLAMSRVNHINSAYLQFDEKERIIDGNEFSDLYSIMAAADVLITDYSNCMFEMSYVGKPVFLYATDVEQYDDTRGMYFDYEKLPFPIAHNERELYDNINSYDREGYKEKQKEFFEDIGVTEDGRAAEKVAKLISRLIEK